MTRSACRIVLWAPRVLGVLVALFVGLFALDVLESGRPPGETLAALFVHLLPSIGLLATVALAWRWEWIGVAVFMSLAGLYAMVSLEHPDWILAISGPLLIVGTLFGLAWRHHAELHPRS